MSGISFINGIKKANKENLSKALSLLVYIPDTRVLIYYQCLYGTNDVHGSKRIPYHRHNRKYTEVEGTCYDILDHCSHMS